MILIVIVVRFAPSRKAMWVMVGVKIEERVFHATMTEYALVVIGVIKRVEKPVVIASQSAVAMRIA